jgi:putative tryptophan/tyrosine transport system substrate-binding protein
MLHAIRDQSVVTVYRAKTFVLQRAGSMTISVVRREFITLLGCASIVWPVAARAQQSPLPVIGFLSGASLETMHEYVAAFQQGLADAGFAEGRNVAIEYRWGEGYNDRLPGLAADLVGRQVAIIVVGASTPGALAAKAATQKIPIVFFVGTDPVKVGLVTSLAHPEANVTGITVLNVDLLAKSLELMKNLMPPDTTIVVLVNPANVPQTAIERSIVQDAERTLGARFSILTASNPSEIESAFATLVSERAGALVVSGENFFLTQRDLVVELAARHTVPTVYPYRQFVLAGGLMAYGTHYSDAFHQIGINAGRILKGEKPADLPVQQVTKIELAINLKTAKTPGLTIPLPLLGHADEVIE